ncbi:MAG: VOC family protein [Dehalococcoidia bacterium]|nr:VOC family protein [Dehalococcoidia bacterium]
MAKYSFDHIHLMSPDPVKTAEFYQKMFNAALLSSRDFGNGGVVVHLKLDGVIILISRTAADGQNGLVHFGVRTDNLEEAVAELKGKGAVFTRDITRINPQLRISFVDGPEAVPIEVQEGGIQ